MSDKADRGGSARARGGDHRLAVPTGQRLGDYRIERVLGVGPFGVTYLALDSQNRRVVIKEYLPSDIVTREGTALRGETATDDDLLRRGRERFLSEGKRLQRVKHASIVRAHNAFEANNTGYLVFEHETGETLADALTGAHTLADEPLLRRFAFTLLDALEAVHEVSFLHGKVEPSNILLRSDGTPVLLDFGNARAATGLTRRASIALVPGYAAIEQYTSHEAQGPWTDLYGLAAVLYRVVSGKDPLDAPARLLEDRLLPAVQAGSGRFSRTFLSGVDAALVVRPEDRPQTVAEWRPMLDRPLAPKAQAARNPENADDDEDDYVPAFAPQERSRTWIYATAGVASVLVLGTLALGGIGYMANNANDPRRSAANSYPAAPSTESAAVPSPNQVMPLPPTEDAAAREARMREDERRVAAQIAAGRAAEEQRAREAARQREQERQTAATRQSDEQKRAAQQQEQARQEQARQEQARQEQERQAAAARAAEEARQREAAARQEQARQEAARQEQARQEQARQEAARQEQARQEAARQQAARAEQERQAAARAAEEAQQRAAAQQQEQARQQEERQAAATRLAEELRQRELIRQQEQAAAARTLEEARVREQARAPAETPRAATTTGSAMLLPPPPPAPAASAPSSAVGSSAVPLTGPVTLTAPPQATPAPQTAPAQQVARATAPPLVQPPVPRPEPVVATPAPVARAADVGRIDAVNWQWGYVVMQMEQRQGMQVGDRVYARSGDTKLWMTVRRVNGTQVSAVPDSDLQRYSVNGRVYKE
jgi:serine/threonine protein kinase